MLQAIFEVNGSLFQSPLLHRQFAGIHGCLGAALARRELDVVLTQLITRFDELALRGRGVSYDSGFMHRGLRRLLMVVR